ncbi:hypothetical protein CJ030_MR1G013977 [Morella rubra]|uniref:Protein RETICULATA-RELATED 4, chloroplastic n=1 Tax=Morella rubra TaxID=262757 RepID=A0A6A1WM89_9ROSI|nr:hypothetical protein CJ030_MR1G013977 [Morella rubra]
MAITISNFSFPSSVHYHHYHHRKQVSPQTFTIITHRFTTTTASFNLFNPLLTFTGYPKSTIVYSIGNGGNGDGRGGEGGGGGNRDGNDDAEDRERNREEAVMALREARRSMESVDKELAAAIEAGRVPGSIVRRYFELEKVALFRWLLRFGGFKERLLADDLFLGKVAMECGVGIFTKTAAELERRREKFSKELDFVFADVVMAIIADFMLVWLPAPTVALRPPLAVSAGAVAKFFYGCPDNAFQVALAGTSYSFFQRIGAIVRNGAKLFAVGTGASLALDKSFAGEAEDVPVLSTSVAYGVYMAVSSNIRKYLDQCHELARLVTTDHHLNAQLVYKDKSLSNRKQVLTGIIEQRILEPLLHHHKIILSAICFAVRTGNTFLGSLMWVDYARWTGIQKIRDKSAA